jgi:hypothetical protein
VGIQQWAAEMSAFDDYLSAPVQQAAPSFDSYLGATPVPAPAAGGTGAAAPQTAAGQPGMLSSALVGFGKGLGNVASGVEQLAGKGASAIGLNGIGNYLTNDANYGLNAAQQGAAPYAAAHPIATGAGQIAGNMVGTAPAMALGPEFAGLGMAGKVGVGALQGAAGGAMMPVQNPGDDYWTQKAEQAGVGGLLGGAIPAVSAGATAVGRGLWNAVQPVVQPGRFVGQGLAGAMDPAEAAAAAANIRSAPQYVPGSVPTTAQAAQTPVMVQTEKASANIPAVKTGMLQRAIDNNDARWQSLMGVAQDPTALDAATQARAAAAQPLYDAAHQATANVGPAFMRYAQIPEMQEAMQRANQIASLDAAVGRGVAPVWPTPQSKAINGAALDYTSRALGDMIDEANRTGAGTKAGALTALKNSVDNWTQSYVPGVQQARAAYAAASVPINTMNVGQQIANGLGTRAMNAGGAPEIGLMPFRSALTKAMGSGDAANFGIDANALSQLQGIGQDLQRATVSNSIRSPGSDTAYNLAANGWLARQLYGPTFGGSTGLGRAIAGIGTAMAGHPWAGAGIASGMGKIGQTVGNRLQDRLSGLLLNPDAALPYLDARAAAAAQGVPGPLMQGLLNYGRPAAVQGLLGGFQNSGNK